MFLANDVVKPWGIFLKGDPIEVISARDKNAIIVKCNGDRLTVSQHDITDTRPLRTLPPTPKAPAPPVKRRRK